MNGLCNVASTTRPSAQSATTHFRFSCLARSSVFFSRSAQTIRESFKLVRRDCNTVKMSSFPQGTSNHGVFCKHVAVCSLGVSSFPIVQLGFRENGVCVRGKSLSQVLHTKQTRPFSSKRSYHARSRQTILTITQCSSSSGSSDSPNEPSKQAKTPFGYTRKDVLLIGVGVTLLGYGLKYGLEFIGVDSLQAGNAVQLVMVLGLTLGWISTYLFRVSNKEMSYAQQLRDYEYKVMEKRLEGLTEAELAALLEQVEEEKKDLANGD